MKLIVRCVQPSRTLSRLTKVQRFTEEQKELITNTVAKLYLEGFSYRAMAIWIKENKNISITHTTVSTYVSKVMDDWRKERISKIDDLLIGDE